MFSQPLIDAIAEAGKSGHRRTVHRIEADLLEGLQYLAGCISGMYALAFDYDRDHPFMHRPAPDRSPRWAWTIPDTMYFGTRVQPGHEYVVTGRRGTTTDLSFQLLGGEYTDDNVLAQRGRVRRS